MATFVRSVLRYIEPFYPATAEEQGRLQRWFLGDAEDVVDDTTGADVSDSELVRETSKRVDAMQNQLKQTTYTVNEIDRHVVRCRRDVDGLVANFGENIAKEYNQKVDAKVAELHKKMEAFERTLQRSCDQAAQHADAHMQELVEKHNAKVQELDDHLREEIAEIEKIVDEKATRAEVAALSTEHSTSKKRLDIFQKQHNVLHEKRGQEIVQIMRKQKTLDGWIKVVRKEQDAAHLESQAEAKARAALDQRIRSLEKQRREKQVFSHDLISLSQNLSSPTLQSAECLQHRSKIEELSKRLGSYESRLKKIEEAPAPSPTPSPARTGPCECCEEALRDVNKRLEKIEQASAAKKLESLKGHFKTYEKAADAHFEAYKKYANTRFESLEGKFEKIAGLVKEPSAPAVDWQAVARLEILEEDKRWNDRVRQLETFGVATPGPVLKHMELLEAKLGMPLYERGFSLPNTVARNRIAWAWNALRNFAREDNQGVTGTATTARGPQNVPQQTLPQPAVYQHHTPYPLGAQIGSPPQQTLVQPAINQQETSDPMNAQPEVPPQQTSQVEMILEPAVHSEAPSQPIEFQVNPQTMTPENMTLQETTEMELLGHDGSPKPTTSELPVQQSMATDTNSTSSSEQQGNPTAQPIYGTDASSAYTTVLGTQSTHMQLATHTTARSSGTGFSMTKGVTQQPSTPYATNRLTQYTPTKPSPLRSIQFPDAKEGTTATPSQQAQASVPSSSFSNYKSAQSSPTTPADALSIQPISCLGAGATSTSLTLPAKTQAHSTAAPGPSKAEEDESHPSTAPISGNEPRKIKSKPKGRLARMTDEQRNAVRTEMQIPASDSRQEPSDSVHPAPIFPAWVKSTVPEARTSSTEAPAASDLLDDGEDEVDYGDSDEDNPTPFSTAAVTKNVTWAAGKTARRYSTQWLKIWRSHVVSERNLRAFAESCGFGDEADKWVAIVENANADTSPPALLSQANIGITRQLYSADDVEEIAKAFFEVCLVQSESFVRAIEKFDPFEVGNYHAKFLAAFKDYLKEHPADSF
ncbi:hypothetical protein SLS53_009056 [Cytospora paraplurivora]|uniref:Uncharacterized protein n=1 Tax=Cytospora paraplurivora TaxID=2898453 RepID=A0AAN9TXJ2_9PEZI